MDDLERQLKQLGRGLVQLNLRVAKLVEQQPPPAGQAGELEVLFDLVDSIDSTLRQPAPRGWWPFAAPVADLSGLRLARDQAVERLAALGVEQIPTSGRPDPLLHYVVELAPAGDPALGGNLARTHRSGWLRPGDPPTVLRVAHVSVWSSP